MTSLSLITPTHNAETEVTIRVSGVRKGYIDKRFPIFTKDEMDSNTAFWASSTKYEQ